MSTIDSENAIDDEDQASPITHGTHFADMKRRMSGTKTPPSLPQISETPGGSEGPTEAEDGEQGAQQIGEAKDHDAFRSLPRLKTRMSMEDAKLLGRSLSNAVLTPVDDKTTHEPYTREAESGNERPLVNPAELTARLYSNPKLAALKSPAPTGIPKNAVPISPPILANPKCSGYFVEPVSANESILTIVSYSVEMAWMEPFLESGEIAGKITCPNGKCGAKLGNYDWAGVKCGCKEWVVPVRVFSSIVIQPLTTVVRDFASTAQK